MLIGQMRNTKAFWVSKLEIQLRTVRGIKTQILSLLQNHLQMTKIFFHQQTWIGDLREPSLKCKTKAFVMQAMLSHLMELWKAIILSNMENSQISQNNR